jgi:rhodanese-related sulfurtransferase
MNGRHVLRQLEVARERLVRVTPRQALKAQQHGAFLVDTRPEYQRRADGEIPGAIVIERNHLEWRLDPCSPSRTPEATAHNVRWIVVCDEGFSSSLAAASLQAIGLVNATDMEGGFQQWRADGCPVTRNNPPAPPRVAHYDTRLTAQASHRRTRPDGPSNHFQLWQQRKSR